MVEERRPRLRLDAQFVGGAAHRRAVAAAGRLGDERLLGRRERSRVGDRAGAVEFADDRARGIRPELTCGERRRDERERGLDALAREPRARTRGRPERDAPAHLGGGGLRHPLEEFGGGAASASRRQALVAELDARPLGDLAGAGRAVGVDESPERLEGRRVGQQLMVGPAGCLVESERSAERRAEVLERVAGAGHGSILAGTTDIRCREKR